MRAAWPFVTRSLASSVLSTFSSSSYDAPAAAWTAAGTAGCALNGLTAALFADDGRSDDGGGTALLGRTRL